MDLKEISTIRRFLGVIEGVAVALPSDAQNMVYGHLEVVDPILDKEAAKHITEEGGERG